MKLPSGSSWIFSQLLSYCGRKVKGSFDLIDMGPQMDDVPDDESTIETSPSVGSLLTLSRFQFSFYELRLLEESLLQTALILMGSFYAPFRSQNNSLAFIF